MDIAARLRTSTVLAYYDQSYPTALLMPATDPHIDTLAPNTMSAAAGAATVTVTGRNFEPTSVVEVDQAPQTTTYVSPTQVTVTRFPGPTGVVMFTVRNASGEESNSVPFTVTTLTADEVVAGTIDEVKAWVADNPDQAPQVAVAERAARARSTLLS